MTLNPDCLCSIPNKGIYSSSWDFRLSNTNCMYNNNNIIIPCSSFLDVIQ